MKLSVLKKMVFVDIGKGYMLAIGTEEEVQQATIEQVGQMILEAIALSQFRDIDTHRKVIKH